MRAARDYGLTVTAWRTLPEVDRLLAMGLAIYEATVCSGCGQDMRYSMDPDLADFWTTAHPHRCHACTALSRASEKIRDQKVEHESALRIEPGLRPGWEEHLEKVRADRSMAAGDPAD